MFRGLVCTELARASFSAKYRLTRIRGTFNKKKNLLQQFRYEISYESTCQRATESGWKNISGNMEIFFT